ncbi:hypothetical protein Lal_00041734 [Lupinus albus]|nr:hypothetical protein Lal_00041734 [Lupinus albus]
MNSVSLSQSKLLPYSIFISRIVDYLRIDVSDTIIVEYTDKDHLVGESLIHKMGIYKYGSTWQYQEDYTTIGLDLSDDDNQDGTDNQHATTQGEPSGSAPQNSAFGFDQLEAMEQRLNNRMDLHFQGLKDSYFAGMERLIVITASDICASYQPCQHNLQAIFITTVTFDVEFVIIKKGEIESVQCQEEHFGKLSLYVLVLMRTTCANKSLKIINKSTCLSLSIVKKNLPNQPGGLDVVCGGQANEPG